MSIKNTMDHIKDLSIRSETITRTPDGKEQLAYPYNEESIKMEHFAVHRSELWTISPNDRDFFSNVHYQLRHSLVDKLYGGLRGTMRDAVHLIRNGYYDDAEEILLGVADEVTL